MSDCIAHGLYYPNCQDSHTTYFGDFLSDDEDEDNSEEIPENEVKSNTDSAEYLLQQYTPEERERNIELYNAEQRVNHCKRQVRRFERLEEFSLDEGNKTAYAARGTEWKERLTDQKNIVHRLKGVANNPESDIINNSYSKDVRKEVREAFENELIAMTEKFGPISTISSVETLPENNNEIYGEFYDHSGVLAIRYANKKDGLKRLAQVTVERKKKGIWSSAHPLHVIRHEIGHAIQLEHKKNDPLWNNKMEKIISIMESESGKSVSKYATENIYEFISECIAESMTKKQEPQRKKL